MSFPYSICNTARRVVPSLPARRNVQACIVVAAFLTLLTPIHAQFAARISGTVTDSSGAVIANATITLMNPSTGEQRIATTSESGFYEFSELHDYHRGQRLQKSDL